LQHNSVPTWDSESERDSTCRPAWTIPPRSRDVQRNGGNNSCRRSNSSSLPVILLRSACYLKSNDVQSEPLCIESNTSNRPKAVPPSLLTYPRRTSHSKRSNVTSTGKCNSGELSDDSYSKYGGEADNSVAAEGQSCAARLSLRALTRKHFHSRFYSRGLTEACIVTRPKSPFEEPPRPLTCHQNISREVEDE
jgi:hypothetical protein